MAEIRNVNMQQADERCPSCGNGFMRPTGIAKLVHPPKYEHACNANCGHKQDYSIRYPYLIIN